MKIAKVICPRCGIEQHARFFECKMCGKEFPGAAVTVTTQTAADAADEWAMSTRYDMGEHLPRVKGFVEGAGWLARVLLYEAQSDVDLGHDCKSWLVAWLQKRFKAVLL